MFRLLKLVAYGLLGYVIYEFIRGAFGGEIGQMVGRLQDQMQGGQGGGGYRDASAESGNFSRDAARANMTGPGEGQLQDTQENDGGSVRHTVGRGVVS